MCVCVCVRACGINNCCLYYLLPVLEVNVIDVNAEKIEDVVFPKASFGETANSWLDSGNSIRLTGNSLRSLGVDGKHYFI